MPGLLGGAVVKNPPSNAGDVGSIPGQGAKIPHAAGQLLSLRAATANPRALEPTCHNDREDCVHFRAHVPIQDPTQPKII